MRNLLLSFLLLSCLKSRAQNIPYGNNKAAGKYYSIRGIKMYCEIYGKGEPLLMLHGNGGSVADFKMNIGYFAKYYKVIVPDMRAQGKSKDAGDSLSYEMMTDDIAALMDALKLDSACIIGWSDGGINGLLLAMHHPKKVKKLAITGANLWPDTSAVIASSVEGDKKRLTELDEKPVKTTAEKNEYKLIYMMQVQPDIKLKDLSAVQCPALVIAGDHDLIKTGHTLLIYQNIPKAYLWIVPNSSHATFQDQKDAFNKTVATFFRQPFHQY